MSQRNVEQVIGRLVTDEGFRRRFAGDPGAVLDELVEGGLVLNPCERRALLALDPRRVESFSESIHPCIQKVELGGADVENGPRRSTNHRTDQGEPDSDAEPLGDTP